MAQSLEDFKKAIADTYEKQRQSIRKEGAERTARMVSTAGRKSALGGITGPLAVAMQREAQKAGEEVTSGALSGVGLSEAKAQENIALKEMDMKQQEDLANQQLISSIFGGVGGLLKDYTPVGKFLTGTK